MTATNPKPIIWVREVQALRGKGHTIAEALTILGAAPNPSAHIAEQLRKAGFSANYVSAAWRRAMMHGAIEAVHMPGHRPLRESPLEEWRRGFRRLSKPKWA